MAQGGGATGFAAADMGLNANIALGSTDVKMSDDYVNDGTEAITAALDLKLHELINDGVNAAGGYVKVIVQINTHRLQAAVLGV